MSLVQSARMNGHDPWAYLRDVLQRLGSLGTGTSRSLGHASAR
ncbi:MAG: hypothetical protein DI563_01110 [Variovorax paradoxus]|uniref:Transposase IS66 C-terminal domain-containing protein n=1 Tax=Variovorax paradoxus TaxID=34073 RepID=A0A2W5S5Y2_VARPD|nr:MAG: hypothetical protein DI563_01110 [Variovorax paradoxus]